MTTRLPPEYLPVRVLFETATLSSSIYERNGPHGRYYIAEMVNEIQTSDSRRVNARLYGIDQLPALSKLAQRTHEEIKRLRRRPPLDPITPEFVN